DGKHAAMVQSLNEFSIVIQIHSRRGCQRCFLPEIEGSHLGVDGTVNDKTTATNVSCCRPGYSQGKCRRYSRVDRIASFFNNISTDFRSDGGSGYHHGLFCVHGNSSAPRRKGDHRKDQEQKEQGNFLFHDVRVMSAKNTNPSALCGIRLSKIHCVRCVFESTHLSGSSFGDADSFDLYRDGNDRKRRLVGNFAEEKDLFIPSCVVAEERAEFLKYQVHRFVDTDFV